MTRKEEQLKNELDEMKGFIDACEIAIDYSLGLDKDTYEKYEAAIKRRGEINDQLYRLKANDINNGLFTTAIMQRKVSEYAIDQCKIDAVVRLSHNEFEDFRNNLLIGNDFIRENTCSMPRSFARKRVQYLSYCPKKTLQHILWCRCCSNSYTVKYLLLQMKTAVR